MKKKQIKFTTFVVLMVFMIVLSACGKTNSVTAPATSAEPATSHKAANSSLDQIKKSGKIIIATSGTFRPVTFTDEFGQLAGYDIDWGNLIAEGLGVKAEFVQGDLSGLITGLVAKKYDIVLSGLLIDDERKKMIDFSDPYMSGGSIAVVREDNTTVTSITNLKDLNVGVIGGSGYMEDVKNIGGYKKIVEYKGSPEAFLDLKAGRIDVYVVGKPGAVDFIAKDKLTDVHLKMVGEEYNPLFIAAGIRKNEDDLKTAINQIIIEKKHNGTFEQLSNKWFGYVMPK